MSGCGGIHVRILGTGVPLKLGMDPPLEVAPPLLGMGDPVGLGIYPTLKVAPPLEVAPTLVVALLLGWNIEEKARYWFSSGQKGHGAWRFPKVSRGGLLWRRH